MALLQIPAFPMLSGPEGRGHTLKILTMFEARTGYI